VGGLALSYTHTDLIDEDSEDIAARLGLYELDGDASFGSLIRFALNPKTISNAAVVICLDWTKPWKFLESLEKYLVLLERELTVLMASHEDLQKSLQDKCMFTDCMRY
jgi:dynein light intermediate chain 1